MDFTGSLAENFAPMSGEIIGSAAGATGSSVIDTLLATPAVLLTLLGSFVADLGADMGSTGGSIDAISQLKDLVNLIPNV